MYKLAPPLQGNSAGLNVAASTVRADELRRWSAELMKPGVAGLCLHGAAGIGKSVLAADIADRISALRPGTRISTVKGDLTVEQLAGILVTEGSAVVILDQFGTNLTSGAIADRRLAAVLVCLAEEITGRGDQRQFTRVIITARQPVTLSQRILIRQVGPLSAHCADELARALPRLGKLTSTEREYAWRLTAGNPGCLRALDLRLAGASFVELAGAMADTIATRTGLSAIAVSPGELDQEVAAAIASAIQPVLSPPPVATQHRLGPAQPPAAPRVPDAGQRRWRRLGLLPIVLVVAAIACAPLAVRPFLAGSSPAVAIAAGRASRPAVRVVPAGQAPEVAAASWLAASVTGSTRIGCDRAMCASLRDQGLDRTDLDPLRRGSDLTADGLIVATSRARDLMGAAITAAAPELAASFGTGSGRVEVREVTPGGAAAYYSWRLAADMASRRSGGNLILGNTSIRASRDTWMVLASGHVDGRILLALAEMAHSAPLTIASFGAADPGAAAEVPVRSVLIDVASPSAASAISRCKTR